MYLVNPTKSAFFNFHYGIWAIILNVLFIILFLPSWTPTGPLSPIALLAIHQLQVEIATRFHVLAATQM